MESGHQTIWSCRTRHGVRASCLVCTMMYLTKLRRQETASGHMSYFHHRCHPHSSRWHMCAPRAALSVQLPMVS
eukprot:1079602-Karenia_brevis.AAC.1